MALPTTMIAIYCSDAILTVTNENNASVQTGCDLSHGWNHDDDIEVNSVSFPTSPRGLLKIMFDGTSIAERMHSHGVF